MNTGALSRFQYSVGDRRTNNTNACGHQDQEVTEMKWIMKWQKAQIFIRFVVDITVFFQSWLDLDPKNYLCKLIIITFSALFFISSAMQNFVMTFISCIQLQETSFDRWQFRFSLQSNFYCNQLLIKTRLHRHVIKRRASFVLERRCTMCSNTIPVAVYMQYVWMKINSVYSKNELNCIFDSIFRTTLVVHRSLFNALV